MKLNYSFDWNNYTCLTTLGTLNEHASFCLLSGIDASGPELHLHLKALHVEEDRKRARVFTSQKTYHISYSDQKKEHIRRK